MLTDTDNLFLPDILAEYQPDIIEVHPFYMTQYKELLYDLNNIVVTDQIDISDIYPSLIEASTVEGELKAIPFSYRLQLLFYDKNKFDQASVAYPSSGMSWEEFGVMASRLDSVGMPVFFSQMEPLIMSAGGHLLSPDDYRAAGYLNNEETVRAIQYMYDLLEENYCLCWINDENSTATQFSYSSGESGSGGAFRYPFFQSNDYGAVGIPRVAEQERVTPLALTGFSIVEDSDNINLAWQFIEESLVKYNDISKNHAEQLYHSTRHTVSEAAGLDRHHLGQVIIEELAYAKRSNISMSTVRNDITLLSMFNREEGYAIDYQNVKEQLDSMAAHWDAVLEQLNQRERLEGEGE